MLTSDIFNALMSKSNLFDIVRRRCDSTTEEGGMLTPKFRTVNLNSVRGILADATVKAKDGTDKSLLGVISGLYGIDYGDLNIRTGRRKGTDSGTDILAEVLSEHLVPAIAAKFPELRWDAPATRSVKSRPAVDLSDIL